MKKHLILLLVVAIALTLAPVAMAQCQKCKPAILACADVETGGYEFCKWTVDNNCYYNTPCTSFQAGEPSEPFAAEYIVASVERLDEPQAASETLVASIETPAPVTQR